MKSAPVFTETPEISLPNFAMVTAYHGYPGKQVTNRLQNGYFSATFWLLFSEAQIVYSGRDQSITPFLEVGDAGMQLFRELRPRPFSEVA